MIGQPLIRPALPRGWTAITENDQNWRKLSYVLILSVGLIMLGTFLDYGLTWDEEVQRIYGDNVVVWYASFFRNRAALDFTFTYGGFFEAVAQLFTKILPFGVYESRHLINCLFGLAAVVTAYKLGSLIARPMAGFFSALFMTLTPVFYGHSFNNPKDIPFSTLFLISLYYIVASLNHLPRIPKSLVIKIGVSIGLAMGVRVGGIVLLGYVAMLWVGWLVLQFAVRPPPAPGDSSGSMLKRLSLSLVSILIIAWAVMLVCWPWAQVKPLVNPVRALAHFARLEAVPKSLFNGQFVRGTDLPWSYLPTWLSISLPEFYLISLLAGCVLAAGFILNFKKDARHFDALSKVMFLALATCLPLIAAMLLRSRLYDGLRHFLFTIAPLAVLAGISFATLLRSRANLPLKTALSILIVISVAITIVDMVQLHPYQYVYFNRVFAGGLKRASGRFETDYWGCSYREGAQWVIDNYPQTQERTRVANCSEAFLTAYYFDKLEDARQRFESVRDDQNPRVFLATTRSHCHKKKNGKILHVVERQGVPLLYVLEFQNAQ